MSRILDTLAADKSDIILFNLAAAEGLPGIEKITPDQLGRYVGMIKHAVERVRQKTRDLEPKFHDNPGRYGSSLARFRMLVMSTVLQREFHFRGRQDTNELTREVFFQIPEYVFVHGALDGKGGTCSSLPILLAGIARRLRYPLKLVATHSHLFARWDDPNAERFNIECTEAGLAIHDDEYYCHWPFEISKERIAELGYLRSMSPEEELAVFQSQRGHCLLMQRRFRETIAAYCQAIEMDPFPRKHFVSLENGLDHWARALRRKAYLGFPCMTITGSERWLRQVPLELEKRLIYLTTKDKLLNNPELARKCAGHIYQEISMHGRVGAPAPPEHILVTYRRPNEEQPDMRFYQSAPEFLR